MTQPTERHRRRDEAAQYIRERHGQPCTAGYLAKLASRGGGPVFRRVGRVPVYFEQDLDVWANARISGPLRKASDVHMPQSEART